MQIPKLFFIIPILLMVHIACKSTKTNIENSASVVDQESSLTLILQDNYSNNETAELLIIREAKSLGRFFSSVNKTRKPGLPIPVIDFTKEMVVVYCSGSINGNSLPRLYTIAETSNNIILEVKQEENQKEAVLSVKSTPFCMYKLPLTQKRVTLNDGIKK